jgi:hypothetical protein
MVEIDNEGSDSLTPITAEYLLKDNSKVDDVFRKVIGYLNQLRTDRIGKAGLNVISAMEPADAHTYINERLDTLGLINEYVTDMIGDLKSELAVLLNSYEDDTTSMGSLKGNLDDNLEKLTIDESNRVHKLGD